MHRDMDRKIPDIKSVRALTSLLGKFDIQDCYQEFTSHSPVFDATGAYAGVTTVQERRTGWPLVTGKRYVERLYDYKHIIHNPRKEIERHNEIHEIKRTRQLMMMLNRFGLQSPDAGLQPCRHFVTRQRARN